MYKIIYTLIILKIIIIIYYKNLLISKICNNKLFYYTLYLYNEIDKYNNKIIIDNNWGQFIVIDDFNESLEKNKNKNEIEWFSDNNDY